MAKAEMRIEYQRLSDVLRAPRNPKQHDAVQMDASIERFGFADPPTLDERTGKLVEGHGRIEALQRRRERGEDPPARVLVSHEDGDWLVPIVRGVSFKSDREAEAYLLAHNRIGDSLWDEAQLAEVLEDHRDDMLGLGWTDVEVDRILAEDDDTDVNAEWNGMPEFDQQDKTADRQIVMNFKSQADAEEFGRLIGQNVTEKTRSLWYPKAEIERLMDKRYGADD